MDYSGLINLALVTIIYSTFISPNLQELGKIREDIANTEFPVIDGETETLDAIELKNVSIDKKMTQYTTKYDEITRFLKYFYLILAIIFSVQITVLIHSHKYTFNNISALGTALVVIILLAMTVRSHMTKPWKIRSIAWLANSGIAPAYTKKLFEPQLVVNQSTQNVINQDEITRINIRSKTEIRGFRYLLSIESPNGERLYYISAGIAAKRIVGGDLVGDNGLNSFSTSIAHAHLKKNKYVARLLLFNAPFEGFYKVCETDLSFKVPSENVSIPVELDVLSERFSYDSEKGKIVKIQFTEGKRGDTSIVNALSSARLVKLMNRFNRPFILEDQNGNLDRYKIDNYCSRRNVLKMRLRRWFKRKSKRTTYYRLSPTIKD